jgi:glycogen debranching enzyme
LSELIPSEGGTFFRRKAEQIEASIVDKMYDPQRGLFFSLDSRDNRDSQIKVVTISSLMPLLLNIPPQIVEGLVKHLTNPEEFWAPYPIAVEPLNYGCEGKLIWRGAQTWVYTNWYIVKGLNHQAQRLSREEYRQIARGITAKTVELVQGAGFREFYDSITGEGRRARNFGWSTLVLDMVYNVEEI